MNVHIFICCLLAFAAGTAFSQQERHTSTSISIPQKPGTILGSNDGVATVTSNLGSASYQFNVPKLNWLPLERQISISYDSGKGDSLLGQGFDINIPFVARSKTLGTPNKKSHWQSFLDGHLVKMPDTGYFRPMKEASFSRYMEGSAGFEQNTGSGIKLKYGTQPNSQEKSDSFVFKHHLSSIEDAFGNRVLYSYKAIDGLSYPTRIDYIGADGIVVYRHVFEYIDRPDVKELHNNGLVQRTKLLISKISGFNVHANSTADRIYAVKFTYGHNFSGVGRSTLKSIQRFGVTDEQAFPAEEFTFSEPKNITANTPAQKFAFEKFGPLASFKNLKFIDFNSDGLLDIAGQLFVKGELTWFVWYNESSDDRVKFVRKVVPDKFQFLDFNAYSTLGDIDGTLRSDLITLRGEGNIRVYRNFVNSGEKYPFWRLGDTPIVLKGLPELSTLNVDSWWVDINRDNKVDYVRTGPNMWRVFYNRGVKNGEVKFEESDQTFDGSKLRHRFRQEGEWGDINGDGLQDYYYINLTDHKKYIEYLKNIGGGSFLQSGEDGHPLRIPVSDEDMSFGWGSFLKDLNGDSIPELISYGRSRVSITHRVGGSYQNSVSLSPCEEISYVDVMDVNGNGSDDLVAFCDETGGEAFFYYDAYLEEPYKNPYLLTSVRSMAGKQTDFIYMPTSKGYSSDSWSDRMPVVFPVVDKIKVSIPDMERDGTFRLKVAKEVHVDYKKGHHSPKWREFLGFETVWRTSYFSDKHDDGLIEKTEYFNKDFFLKGRSSRREIAHATGKKTIRVISDSWKKEPLDRNNVRYFSHIAVSETTDIDSKANTKKSKTSYSWLFQPDTLTPQSKTTTEFDAGGKPYRTRTRRYIKNRPDKWVWDRVSENVLNDPATGKSYGWKKVYDDNYLLKEEYTGHPGAWQSKYRYTYYTNGQLASAIDGFGHTTKISYDGGRGFLPSKIEQVDPSNATSHEVAAKYDFSLGGKVVAYIDKNQNKTAFTWDGFGRLSSVKPPNSSKPNTIYSYEWGTDKQYAHISEKNLSVEKPTTRYFDGLGRLRAVVSPSETGTIISDYTEFDQGGRAIISSMPIMASNGGLYAGIEDSALDRLISTQFDTLSRPIVRKYPDGSSESWQYNNGIEITYNRANEPTVKYLDHFDRHCASDTWNIEKLPNGKIPDQSLNRFCGQSNASLASKDISRIEASYSVFDKVTAISATAKPIRTYRYDTQNRLSEYSSPDSGRRVWQYDELNRPVAVKVFDALNNPSSTIFTKYDFLDRPTERRTLLGEAGDISKDWQRATSQYRYLYDAPSGTGSAQENLVGRLSKVDLGQEYAIHYSYAPDGEVKLERLVGNKQDIRMQFEYDVLGRMTQMTYPDGSKIGLGYSKATGAPKGAWGKIDTYIDYSPLNQIARLKTDDLRQEYWHHPLTDLLSRTKAKFNEAEVADYRFSKRDHLGRLLEFSGNDLGAKGINKAFKYDLKGQLIQSVQAFETPSTGKVSESWDYSYTLGGEILRNEGKELQYSKAPSGLLAKISHGKDVYTFDSQGRLTSGPAVAKVNWDALGRVGSIDGQASKSSFRYLDTNERFLETKEVGGSTRTSLILNRYYEKDIDTGSYVNYYFSGDRLVASDHSGTGRKYYLADSINSKRLVLDSKGKIDSYTEYRPFGSVLFEKMPQNAPKRRFAGAIFDKEVGLYQMGARYYQPKLGRFLSSDPFMVSDPEACRVSGVQCSDLWSYASNDPVNNFDPSGYYAARGHDQKSEQEARDHDPGGRNREARGEIDGPDQHERGIESDDISFEVLGSIGGAIIGGGPGSIVGGALGRAAKKFGPRLVKTVRPKITSFLSKFTKKTAALCFVAGTAVLTPSGYANIEDIQVGDLVVSRDAATGETSYKEVVNLFENDASAIVNLTFKRPNSEQEYINTTYEHPFFVKDVGWVQAGELAADATIETIDGYSSLVDKSVSYTYAKVYNFEVADYHTYFVGDDGYLVHNSCRKVGVGGGKRAGKAFTAKGKRDVIEENVRINNGKTICSNCGVETVKAAKSIRGVRPPSNETQVDHIMPRSLGGNGDPLNGQVLCRSCNIAKGNKWPW